MSDTPTTGYMWQATNKMSHKWKKSLLKGLTVQKCKWTTGFEQKMETKRQEAERQKLNRTELVHHGCRCQVNNKISVHTHEWIVFVYISKKLVSIQ